MNDRSSPPTPLRREWVSNLWRLGVILAFTLATRAWVLTHTEVTSRDSIAFIRYALQLEEPPADSAQPDRPMTRTDVLKATPHPPGYAAALLGVSGPVRAALGGTTCEAMVLSAQLTSVLSALLLVFPMYFLGKLVFDRQTAFVGTLLFQVLPVTTIVTSDGLSDSLFLLTAATALWFAALGFRRHSGAWFLGAGVVSGLAYLVRPEGLVIALTVGLAIAGCKWRAGWAWKPTLARGGLLAAGLLAVMTPYVTTIGRLTNKPTGLDVFNWFLGGEIKPSWTNAPDAVGAAPAVGVPIAEWWVPEYGNRRAWAVKALTRETAKTAFYVLPLFAALGMYLLRRQTRDDAATMLLVVFASCHLLLLWVIAGGAGYVAERHTLPAVLVGCFFAAAAIPELGRRAAATRLRRFGSEKCWAAFVAVALVAGCVPAGMKTLHANRAGHRAAGQWLAPRIEPGDLVVDPFAWVEFYSGHIRMPSKLHAQTRNIYIIDDDPKANAHPRLHLMKVARDVVPLSQLVYFWPEDRPREAAKIFVYRLVLPPRDLHALAAD